MSTISCGFPDEDFAHQPPTAYDSYIGGIPTALVSPDLNAFYPSTCPNCKEPLYFVMQIYCPVDCNDRILYFFFCPKQSCQTSGRFCRVYRLTTQSKIKSGKTISDLTTALTDWNLDSGADDAMDQSLNLDQKGPRNDSVSSATDLPSYAVNHLISPFKCYYINVYEEKTQSSPISNDLSSWVLDYIAEEEFLDEDEKLQDLTTPRYQEHLASRDAFCGLEPIRYSWKGTPIFTSAPPSSDWEPNLVCSRCRSCRVFEVQLFPTINSHLHFNEKECFSGNKHHFNATWPLNFSTLIVFSCGGDCQSIPLELIEECVLVQNDDGGSSFINGA